MKAKMILLICSLLAVYSNAFTQTGYFGEYFRHQCRDTNQFENQTILNHPLLNGDDSAFAIITSLSLVAGVDENFNAGIWYNGSEWAVFNESLADSIPLFTSFNVLIPDANGTTVKHIATPLNVNNDASFIEHAATNNKPNALLFITHNWGASGGVYNNHPTAVYYNPTFNRWNIVNTDGAPFPEGAVYNVFVVDSENAHAFIHTSSTPSVVTPYLTYLDHPYLNNNTDAVIFVTPNLSPRGVFSGLTYDPVPIGVGMKGTSWFIFNKDRVSDIDSNASYNVLIAQDFSSRIAEADSKHSDMRIFPNPSSSEITISYELKEAALVSLRLYDIIGQESVILFEEKRTPGIYTLKTSAEKMTPGIYFCVLSVNDSDTRKPVVIVR